MYIKSDYWTKVVAIQPKGFAFFVVHSFNKTKHEVCCENQYEFASAFAIHRFLLETVTLHTALSSQPTSSDQMVGSRYCFHFSPCLMIYTTS